MNLESIQLMESIVKLESIIPVPTSEQAAVVSDLKAQISRNSRFYEVAALTVGSMREHGYDITDKDAGIIMAIAGKVEIDPDVLWGAVEVWANYYNVKRIDQDDISERIDMLYTLYVDANSTEPNYANCTIRFLDDENSIQEVTIKLSSEVVEQEDDRIFFYCNTLSGLKSLTSVGMEDFIVTKINSLE
ncbi:MAG: hypothetical protein RR471_08055 [Bacteroides sp.]